MNQGFEVGVVLGPEGTEALVATLRSWENDLPWRFELALARNKHLGDLCLAKDGLRDGVRQVEELQVVKLADVVAESASDLEGTPEPKLPSVGPKQFVHRVRYEWQVVAPRLPKQAKELKKTVNEVRRGKGGKQKTVQKTLSYDPRMYTYGGQTMVLLESLERLEAARGLATESGGIVVVR